MVEAILATESHNDYREWYRNEQPSLYMRYGKSLLAIDSKTYTVARVFKYTEFGDSVSFCVKHHFIHQLCDKVFYDETEMLPTIR